MRRTVTERFSIKPADRDLKPPYPQALYVRVGRGWLDRLARYLQKKTGNPCEIPRAAVSVRFSSEDDDVVIRDVGDGQVLMGPFKRVNATGTTVSRVQGFR